MRDAPSPLSPAGGLNVGTVLLGFALAAGAELLFYALLIQAYPDQGMLPDGYSILSFIDTFFANQGDISEWDFSTIANISIILLYSPEMIMPGCSLIINICLLLIGFIYLSRIGNLMRIPQTYVLLVFLLNSYVFYAAYTPNKETVTFCLYTMVSFYFLSDRATALKGMSLILTIVRPIHIWSLAMSFCSKHRKLFLVACLLLSLTIRYVTAEELIGGSFVENRQIHWELYSGTYSASVFLDAGY